MNALRCEAVSKSFNGVCVLKRVWMELTTGAITAIVGPNGAGKTTLVDVLTGFVKPDTGRCYVGQQEITGEAPHRLRRFGVVRSFQDLRLISRMTVEDNVMLACPVASVERPWSALAVFGRKEERVSREKARSILSFLSLDHVAANLAGALSYGQQKLLTLACCLATGANVLLLDEPISGVHPAIAESLLDRLRELAKEGKAIGFIEHDLLAVRQVAEHILVMDRGSIIAQGHPEEVLERPEILNAYLS